MESVLNPVQHTLIDPLRPYLLPLTTNLPKPLNDLIISLLGEPCHSALLLDLDIASHPQCISLAVSKAMGIAIITAASVVKVPQIIKLIRSKSAQGLSITGNAMETASFLVTLAYNVRNGLPFSTYGESVFILIQNVVIAVLILVYSGQSALAGAFVAAVGSAVYALLFSDTIVSTAQMTSLQAGAGALSIFAKLPQILTIYSQGGTGQLSAFAVFNYLLGSLTRIFTTLQEVDDKLILYGFVAGFTLNAVLAAQMVYYWNSPTTAGHGAEAKLTKEKYATIKGVGQSGAQGLATEENLVKAGVPVGVSSSASAARPGSASGRRRA